MMIKASEEITKHYLSTTSIRSCNVGSQHYRISIPGLRRRLGKWLPTPETRVLDLGCGLGELLFFCEDIGCKELVGVNLCQEEIDIARRFMNAEFHCADILDYLRSTEMMFDWIGAMNILEHLEKDRVLETLKFARKRLNPGGVFVAMVPNAISPFGNLTRHWDYTHEWAFTPNNFRQLAPLAGFSRKIDFRECGPVPYGFRSVVRYILWQCIRMLIKGYFLVEVADTKGGVYTMDMMVRLQVSSQGAPT